MRISWGNVSVSVMVYEVVCEDVMGRCICVSDGV